VLAFPAQIGRRVIVALLSSAEVQDAIPALGEGAVRVAGGGLSAVVTIFTWMDEPISTEPVC
jgi:hypothetical protein